MMRLRVLGCNGGIGAGLHATALLFGRDILIDAGTGVGDLDIESDRGSVLSDHRNNVLRSREKVGDFGQAPWSGIAG